EVISTMKYVKPRCFGTLGSVRATNIPHFAMCARVVQTFWPLTTHSSPSLTARVASPARSEPAPGSLKSWHQILLSRRERTEVPLPLPNAAVRHDRRRAHAVAERVDLDGCRGIDGPEDAIDC